MFPFLWLLKPLTNWRVLLALAVAAFIGVCYFKYTHTMSQLKAAKEANVILENNVKTLDGANKQNELVITQLQVDKTLALQSLNNLTGAIAKTNKSLNEIQKKVNSLSVPPALLTPYLIEAIDGIQKERQQSVVAPGQIIAKPKIKLKESK